MIKLKPGEYVSMRVEGEDPYGVLWFAQDTILLPTDPFSTWADIFMLTIDMVEYMDDKGIPRNTLVWDVWSDEWPNTAPRLDTDITRNRK